MGVTSLAVRLFSLASVAWVVAAVSANTLTWLVVFLGQAHFILAYWYKFSRVPNLLYSHVWWLWIVTSVLLIGVGVMGWFSLEVWLAIAGVVFIFHHAYDDLSLSVGRQSWWGVLAAFAGLHTLFLLEILEVFAGVILLLKPSLLLALATVVITVWFVRKQSEHISVLAQWYLLGVSLLSSGAIFISYTLNAQQVLGFIILVHYVLWYIEYYRKLQDNRPALSTYLFRSVLINAIMLCIYMAARNSQFIPGFEYVFGLTFFYIWTVLHIIFSFVPNHVRLW